VSKAYSLNYKREKRGRNDSLYYVSRTIKVIKSSELTDVASNVIKLPNTAIQDIPAPSRHRQSTRKPVREN
jgi:hypothetical protein